jgi:pimeloyl-ACP methyl ester carboxylesterase
MTIANALTVLAAALAVLAGPAHGQQIGPDSGEQSAVLLGTSFQISTYRPPNCVPRLILAVFHGNDRDAGPHRKVSRPIANTYCAIVVAPRFEKQQFSDTAFSLGGVVDNGALVPPGKRTVDYVAPLIAWARAASGQPALPFALLGHSGGAQLVDRVAAYVPTDARRFVIANPSTWVLPNLEPAPYGFGGIGTPADAEKAIRAYLARPIVVLLGGKDTSNGALAMNREAVAQGENRLMRGRNSFALAESVAHERKWPFGWKKLEVPDLGHDFSNMLESRQAVDAFK